MSESELLSNCLEFLQILRNQGKAWYMRVNSGMAFFGSGKKKYAIRLAPEGTSDILIIKDGKVIWVETKDIDGKQSEAQIAFQKEVIEYGCKYAVIRDLGELIAITEG